MDKISEKLKQTVEAIIEKVVALDSEKQKAALEIIQNLIDGAEIKEMREFWAGVKELIENIIAAQ
jgi:phage-related protein